MDFYPFDWFNVNRLSAHLLNLTNMVNERASDEES